jgi:hypothetical protein
MSQKEKMWPQRFKTLGIREKLECSIQFQSFLIFLFSPNSVF